MTIPTPQDNTWSSIWNRYFPPLSPSKVQEWEYELLSKETGIRNLTANEMASAIRELVEDQDCPKYPQLRELKRAIWKHREKAKLAASMANGPQEQCAYCWGSGWMSALRCYTRNNGVLFGENEGEPDVIIRQSEAFPCACSNGRRILALNYADKQEQMIELSRSAMQWRNGLKQGECSKWEEPFVMNRS